MEDLKCTNCGGILVAILYLGEMFDVSTLLTKCPICGFEYITKGVITKQSLEVEYDKGKTIHD